MALAIWRAASDTSRLPLPLLLLALSEPSHSSPLPLLLLWLSGGECDRLLPASTPKYCGRCGEQVGRWVASE